MINEETTSILEKRRASRAPVPTQTTSFIINSDCSLDEINVQDMSVFGMLVSFKQTQYGYPIDSVLNDIYIHIPPNELNVGHRSILLVYDGKIVRSFFDKRLQSSCYGIEFTHKRLYINEKTDKLIKQVALDKKLKQTVSKKQE